MGDRESIYVALELAGEIDRTENAHAGKLTAYWDSGGAATCLLEAFIHIDRKRGVCRLGPVVDRSETPHAQHSQLCNALEKAWRTGRDVDVLDELGRPLMKGAFEAMPGGISKWLAQYGADTMHGVDSPYRKQRARRS